MSRGKVTREVYEYRASRVAQWTLDGESAREIATRLGISTGAVVEYRRRTGVSRAVDWKGSLPLGVWEWRCERVAEWSGAGVSVADMAARLKITTRSVERYRERAGVSQPAGEPLTADELARAQQLLDDGCSLAEVARTLGRWETTINRRFPGRGWTPEQTREHLADARHMKELERKLVAV